MESPADLHLGHPAHIVCHHFFCEILRLSNNGNFAGFACFNLALFVLYRQVLSFNMLLHVRSLVHIGHLNLGGLNAFPFFESRADKVTSHAVDSSLHESLAQLKFSDIFFPSGDAVFH